MRTADHLQAIDDRLDRLDAKIDERFAGVDARFTGIDQRFDQVDQRFEQVDKHFERVDKYFEQIERRFEEQRARSDALYEASRADFRNLYDLVKAQGERTDARFDRLQAEIRTSTADIHLILKNHERRLVVVERRTLKTKR